MLSLIHISIDYKFVNDGNWEEAVRNSPDPDWHPRPQNKKQYWETVTEFLNIKKRYENVQ